MRVRPLCAVLPVALLAVACSSSSSSSSGAAATLTAYCQSEVDSLIGCYRVTDSCKQAVETACPQAMSATSSAYSAAALAAVVGCLPSKVDCSCFSGTTTCAQDETEMACEVAALSTLTPSAAQQQVKTDFCASCPDSKSGISACADFFALPKVGADAGTGTADGVGVLVLMASDSLAEQIDTQCAHGGADASALGGCVAAFEQCASKLFEQESQAMTTSSSSITAACGDGGFVLLDAGG